MISKPILFSGEMVNAILQGRKTQTRRVIKFPQFAYEPDTEWVKAIHSDEKGNWIAWGHNQPELAQLTKQLYPNGDGFACPYGKPGDTLWVRETWNALKANSKPFEYVNPRPAVCFLAYKATENQGYDGPWHPSIFMPRWASRITLEVTDVRVERLQEISATDAIAEGITRHELAECHDAPVLAYRKLWDKINKQRGHSWDSDPWVWVLEFRRLPQ